MKISKWMIFMTMVSLVYIHMQMNIFDLAYQGKTNEKSIRALKEENGNVTYNILRMKSANHLGYQLLEESSDMEFLHNSNVIQLTTPSVDSAQDVVRLERPGKKTKTLARFFTFAKEAQAREHE